MENDPRGRNLYCDTASLSAYLASYAARLGEALARVDGRALEAALALIDAAAAGGRVVYSVGNGGSAAIADHLCCDLTKGTHHHAHPVIDSRSLVANVPLYTAAANDFGFEQAFSAQLAMLGKAGDVLIAISSSGNSANILNAVAAAHERGMATIGLSGFGGGALAAAAQVSLHVADDNYGIVEDAHQALMHILAQYIAARRDGA